MKTWALLVEYNKSQNSFSIVTLSIGIHDSVICEQHHTMYQAKGASFPLLKIKPIDAHHLPWQNNSDN